MPQFSSTEAGTGSDSAIMRKMLAAVDQPTEPPFVLASEPQSEYPPLAKETWLARIEPVRLFFHISSISLAGFLCQQVTDPYWRGVILCVALALFALYELARTRWTGRFAALLNLIVVREQEKRTRSASMDFMIGFSLSFLCFRPEVLAPAVYATAWCDPIARLVGVSIGRHRWPGTKKTVEGSLGCLITAATVAWVCLPFLSWPALLSVGASALVVEMLPQMTWRTRFGDILSPADNCFITMACAAALSYFVPELPQV